MVNADLALEQVASALRMANPDNNRGLLETCSTDEFYRFLAKAAIKAMPPNEGWVLVPKEPTPEMLAAGVTAPAEPYNDLSGDVANIYRAMLAAAPGMKK